MDISFDDYYGNTTQVSNSDEADAELSVTRELTGNINPCGEAAVKVMHELIRELATNIYTMKAHLVTHEIKLSFSYSEMLDITGIKCSADIGFNGGVDVQS